MSMTEQMSRDRAISNATADGYVGTLYVGSARFMHGRSHYASKTKRELDSWFALNRSFYYPDSEETETITV